MFLLISFIWFSIRYRFNSRECGCAQHSDSDLVEDNARMKKQKMYRVYVFLPEQNLSSYLNMAWTARGISHEGTLTTLTNLVKTQSAFSVTI